jgi:CubicO group peptidase (beta-lactamase class C family)
MWYGSGFQRVQTLEYKTQRMLLTERLVLLPAMFGTGGGTYGEYGFRWSAKYPVGITHISEHTCWEGSYGSSGMEKETRYLVWVILTANPGQRE